MSAAWNPLPTNACSRIEAIIGSSTTKNGVVVSTLFLSNLALADDRVNTILEVDAVIPLVFAPLHSISSLPVV